ncbi:MAG: hypothetical protein GEV09_02245 [Pseudonocardiaceae bacterium]|nr:hypothetical protein [Pseudonocardiaceae bacterium]
MLKSFDSFHVQVHASQDSGVSTQLLFYQDDRFAGRIDFYAGQPLPISYLWHPTGTDDEIQVYVVLAMPVDRFHAVLEILDEVDALGLELWPVGPMFGATTDGYGGVLRSLQDESVGEADRAFLSSPRPR